MRQGTGPTPRDGGTWRYMVLIFFIIHLSSVNCQRLRDMMYESLYSGGVCFRRLNGTHQIGCSSKRGGSVGVVHSVLGLEDVHFILNNGTAGPYAAFLPIHLFTESIVDQLLENSHNVAGIIVYNNRTENDEKIEWFTHEQKCPNVDSQWMNSDSICPNPATNSVWNPKGSGLMYRDFPFPIFYLPPDKQEDMNKIYDCYIKFNSFDLNSQSSRSLCAIEMDSFMFAAVSSQLCMRRSNIVKNLSPVRYCDPLADRSVFTTLFPRGIYSKKINESESANEKNLELIKPYFDEKPGSVILVTAQMDAASMLKGLGDGGVTTITGLVTLLATAQALGSMLPLNESKEYDKNVMFVLLNGETFDYIGSQRMAVDLAAGNFPQEGSDPVPPLNPMSIGLHVHIGQLQNDNEKLYAFVPNYNETEKSETVSSFINFLNTEEIYGTPNIINGSIPPSSVHSFMRFLNTSSTKMASVVLASHGRNFKNRYYQSILDDKEYLQYNYKNLSHAVKRGKDYVTEFPDSSFSMDSIQVRLANISNAIAKSLHLQITKKDYHGPATASPFIVDELLHCYMDTINCRLATVTQSPETPPIDLPSSIPPLSLYVGVTMWSPIVQATAQFTAFLTGTNVSRSKDDCKRLDNEAVFYEWVAGWFDDGVCIMSIINMTRAISPAFMDDDYNYASGIYSSWTESVWDSISLRILVKPAPWREGLIIGIGCGIFILSVILVLLGKRHVVWLIDSNISENRINISTQPTSRVDC